MIGETDAEMLLRLEAARDAADRTGVPTRSVTMFPETLDALLRLARTGLGCRCYECGTATDIPEVDEFIDGYLLQRPRKAVSTVTERHEDAE